MSFPRRLWWLLPLGLSVVSLLLLVRVSVLDRRLQVGEDLDVLLTMAGLTLATITAIALVVVEGANYLRQQSAERAREAGLSEHVRFLRRLDHEIKSPLTALQAGLASLALIVSDPQQQHIVRTLRGDVTRLTQLVTGLRRLAELEKLPLETRVIDVPGLIREVVELEQERLEPAGRQIEVTTGSDPSPSLVGDYDLLLLALHNLVDNAIKYTQPGGKISISTRMVADSLVIEVADTGSGIAAEDLPLVWEELYRGRNAENTPGSGIGLSLVRAIVERHYGSVQLESQVGEGTRVMLTLPTT